MKVEDLIDVLSEIDYEVELEAMVDPMSDDIILFYNENGSDDQIIVARF
jgi:hypothetical protein